MSQLGVRESVSPPTTRASIPETALSFLDCSNPCDWCCVDHDIALCRCNAADLIGANKCSETIGVIHIEGTAPFVAANGMAGIVLVEICAAMRYRKLRTTHVLLYIVPLAIKVIPGQSPQ
jgi:hypothetical protein